ncbi:MAG: DUF721 domain-containing protein [Calditerrivibrio sp.]|nr:DUF721 domain-containing protein [Calditerrivibrio sp.]
MQRIGEVISLEVFNENVNTLVLIIKHWKRIMGDFIGENSLPIKLTDGKLTVIVPDNIWMMEFTMMKQDFVQRLADFGYGGVKDIKFVVKKFSPIKEEPFTPKPVTDDMLRMVKECSKPIKDENLKGSFEKAFLSWLRSL